MAYYRNLFILYIHCSSQRCVKQRRVAFRAMGKAERYPVVKSASKGASAVVRVAAKPVLYSKRPPPVFSPHKHQVSAPY